MGSTEPARRWHGVSSGPTESSPFFGGAGGRNGNGPHFQYMTVVTKEGTTRREASMLLSSLRSRLVIEQRESECPGLFGLWLRWSELEHWRFSRSLTLGKVIRLCPGA